MTHAEKLIWAAAFVAETNKRTTTTRTLAMANSIGRADETVALFRDCVAQVHEFFDNSLILEFAEDSQPQRKECPRCRAAAFKNGHCLGCGAAEVG